MTRSPKTGGMSQFQRCMMMKPSASAATMANRMNLAARAKRCPLMIFFSPQLSNQLSNHRDDWRPTGGRSISPINWPEKPGRESSPADKFVANGLQSLAQLKHRMVFAQHHGVHADASLGGQFLEAASFEFVGHE